MLNNFTSSEKKNVLKKKRIAAHMKEILDKQKSVLFSVITSDDDFLNGSDDDCSDYDYENQPLDQKDSRTTVISA